jgi:hypothetical protein
MRIVTASLPCLVRVYLFEGTPNAQHADEAASLRHFGRSA